MLLQIRISNCDCGVGDATYFPLSLVDCLGAMLFFLLSLLLILIYQDEPFLEVWVCVRSILILCALNFSRKVAGGKEGEREYCF
jgi:hypothetical protein